MEYIFPAIFEKCDDGGFTVTFPDIAGATEGDNLPDALKMAEDALNFALESMKEEGEQIPLPSNPLNIALKQGQFLTLIKTNVLNDKYEENLAVTA